MNKLFISVLFFLFPLGSHVNVNPVSQLVTTSSGSGIAWDRALAVTNGRSEWILAPKGCQGATLQITVASNTAYIEYTATRVSDLSSNSTCFIWSPGAVSTNAISGIFVPISAWRLVGLTNVARVDIRI